MLFQTRGRVGGSSNGRTSDSDSEYLGSNPSPPAKLRILSTDRRLLTRSHFRRRGGPHRWSTRGFHGLRQVPAAAALYILFSVSLAETFCGFPAFAGRQLMRF